MPQVVHVAVEGDPGSARERAGQAGDRFRRHLADVCPPGTRLEYGPYHTVGADTSVLIGSRVGVDLIRSLPRLHTIIVPWSGVPTSLVDVVAQADRRIEIRNIHHNAASAAETAIGLLLAVARGIPSLDADLRRHDWRQRYLPRPSVRLEGSEALVLGRGAIGHRLARTLTGLGMTARSLGRPPSGPRWAAHDLARHARGVTAMLVAIPANADTEGIVDGVVLDAMPGGIVVNVGRGSVIEETALFERLADHRLFGAGLDVWWRAPTREEEHESTAPSNLPFHELSNVVMTPHVGGGLGEPGIEEDRATAVGRILFELGERTARQG